MSSQDRLLTTMNSVKKLEENVTLMWFNPGDDDKNKIVKNINIICYTDIDILTQSMETTKNQKIFVIISAEDAVKYRRGILELSSSKSLFIFPANSTDLFDNIIKEKIVGSFNNSDDLIQSIKETVDKFNKCIELPSNYNRYQQGTCDLSKYSGRYLWFQLFHEVIQHLSPDDDCGAKEEMLNVCRQIYQDNDQTLKTIDEFDRTFQIKDCIRWYTKPTFIFEIINKALRTEDIEQLYQFRYYIAGLSKQLHRECEKMKNKNEEKLILYRGSGLHKQELESLTLTKGKLIATNEYWSTSRNISCAEIFIRRDSDFIPVLYEIECDLCHCKDSIIFADISSLSQFGNAEEEYLFNAGSIFQVESIEQDVKNDYYSIKIKTTDKGGELAKQYKEIYREDMKYESPRLMIGILLKRIGQYNKSLDYFRKLLKNPGGEKLSRIHNRIGIALQHQNKCEEALEHLNEAYNLASKSNSGEEIHLALILHGKGLVFDRQRKFSKALECHTQAINIFKSTIGDNNGESAAIYSSIGRYYWRVKDHEKAIIYQNKASEIRKLFFPPKHHIHAFSYIDIARSYWRQGKYDKALDCNLMALKLRQECLLPEHLNIASSLYFIGKIYFAMKNRNEALDYYQKSLEMTRKCLPPPQQRNVSNILEDIAKTFEHDPGKALEYRLEALSAQKRLKPKEYEHMVRTLDNIARTYRTMKLYEKSIEFYKKALDIRQRYFPDKMYDLMINLDRLATVYEDMKKLRKALHYYRSIMKMCNTDLHSYGEICRKTRKNIARLQQKLEHNHQ
ncbi:hypothetical protein I4U23_005144 [Adineta vaga]|nr:hypothetical protein I4U23_005144 [Adineta vaga]